MKKRELNITIIILILLLILASVVLINKTIFIKNNQIIQDKDLLGVPELREILEGYSDKYIYPDDRPRFNNWLEQAEKDLVVAEKNFILGEYYVTNFFCEQAVEKTLKSWYVFQTGKLPPRNHNLELFLEKTNMPEEFHEDIAELEYLFLTTRYPDEVNGSTPYLLTNKKQTKRYLQTTKDFLNWTYYQMFENP